MFRNFWLLFNFFKIVFLIFGLILQVNLQYPQFFTEKDWKILQNYSYVSVFYSLFSIFGKIMSDIVIIYSQGPAYVAVGDFQKNCN